MNIANVTAGFAAYTGLSGDELLSQSALIESAADYIDSITAVENPDERQIKRLENLSAVYACRLYEIRGSDVTSFTAGDVKITSSAGGKGGAEALWQEQKKLCSDILRAENFLFGRM